MTARLNDAEWLRRQLGADEHSADAAPCDVAQNLCAPTGSADGDMITGRGEFDVGGERPRRLNLKVAVRFGGLATAALVISLLGTMLLYGGDKSGGKPKSGPFAQPAAVASTAAPAPVAAEAVGVDRPLPFTASANCPAGSTSAQTLAGADPTNAFVCVRDLVDGQVLRIDLSKSYVITAISITPGWVGKDSSGTSQWAQHRVVTRVQYVFNDTDRTIIVQDTGNVHGEAVQPVKHVLASKITMLILQTSRPPADTTSLPPTPGLAPPDGGLFGAPNTSPTSPVSPEPLLGLGGKATTDPVDTTFAISRLQIIGHEAI